MLFWIIQQTIISIVLIISVHYIYIFFKNNLTIPKTKDLVNRPTEQYKNIYKSLNNSKENNKEMKNELKDYLKKLTSKKPIHKNNTVESVGDTFNNNNSFTTF